MTAPRTPNHSALPDRWLAYRLGHLGDIVLTTGVLAHFAERRGWRFAVATKAAFAPLFDGSSHVERVFALDRDDLDFSGFRTCSRHMAEELPGWGLLDLHGSIRSRLLGLRWPGTVARYPKMGFARRAFLASRGRLFGEALRTLSVPQRYALAIEEEAPPPSLLLPRVVLSPSELAEADARLAALPPSPGSAVCPATSRPSAEAPPPAGQGRVRPVALHPYATHVLKAWPKEHWIRLTDLLDANGLPWISIGTGTPLFPGRKEDLTGSTTLRQSCALLARSRVLVTGDSGPMHLATAMGTPVTALFGPTTREWGFYPAGPFDTVLKRPLACRPCSLHGRRPCARNGECLARISPEEVLAAVMEMAGGA